MYKKGIYQMWNTTVLQKKNKINIVHNFSCVTYPYSVYVEKEKKISKDYS